MDDLLKRQTQAGAGGFEPDGLQGGDLSGGDGLQSKGWKTTSAMVWSWSEA